MDERADELIPTRATLIHRLKDWQDQASWQVFFDTYWRLIYNVATQGGLTPTEAEEVVQQTMISVAKHMPAFKYDPALGSFKAWLLTMTRWRMTDQLRKRQPLLEYHDLPAEHDADADNKGPALTASSHVAAELEQLWDAEWEKNLLAAAIAKARRELDPKQYQIFDCHVNKGWTPERVAKALGVSVNQVYLAKHRVTEQIKAEAERLQKEVV